jgi:hypothetical protein
MDFNQTHNDPWRLGRPLWRHVVEIPDPSLTDRALISAGVAYHEHLTRMDRRSQNIRLMRTQHEEDRRRWEDEEGDDWQEGPLDEAPVPDEDEVILGSGGMYSMQELKGIVDAPDFFASSEE